MKPPHLKFILSPISPLVVAAFGLSYFLLSKSDFPPLLTYKADADPLKVATGVLVLTLIIERAVQILLGIQRDKDGASLKQSAQQTKAEVERLKAQAAAQQKAKLEAVVTMDGPRIEALGQLGVSEALVTLKTEAAAEAEISKTVYDKETEQQSAALGFILALVASLLGVRLLSSFWSLPATASGTATPTEWFTAFDIFVTAALVSGGSQGLHLLLSTIGSMVEQAKPSKPAT